jgi:hypothetical protein
MSKNMNPTGHSTKDEWLTPPQIIKALGEFDLDPCAPINRPWPTAKNHYTILDDGLMREWFGRVWMNPPYGKALVNWLNRLALHGNGLALTFARTDTAAFHKFVFPVVDSILFLHGRITFYNVDGTPGSFNGGAPSVLLAYGGRNSEAIHESGLKGKHVLTNRIAITVVGLDITWRVIVKTVFINLNRPAELDELYAQVEALAPEKVRKNSHYKAKIRQTVQQHFSKVNRGVYALKTPTTGC